MANTDVIDLIIEAASDYFVYMLPVIAFLSGVMFITSFLYAVTIGTARKAFRG